MASDRRIGLLVLVVGAVVALSAQLGAPTRRPLYDGVVVTEPYEWLDPPEFNLGGATGVLATVQVKGSGSPLVAVATGEQPPQAQILATPGALRVHAGAKSIAVSIEPIRPPIAPPSGFIDGNVYEVQLDDDAGQPVTAPAETEVTVVLRSADPLRTDASIIQFDGTSWVTLPTTPSGDGEFFATVTQFGDFAVLAQGDDPYVTPAPSVSAGTSPTPGPSASTPRPVPGSSPAFPGTTSVPGSSPSGLGGIPLAAWILGLGLLLGAGGLGGFVWLRRRGDGRRGS